MAMIYVTATAGYLDYLTTIAKAFKRSDCVPEYLDYERALHRAQSFQRRVSSHMQ